MEAERKIKGFTLIELLVVTAIIGVLSVVSSQIVNSVLKSQDKNAAINEIRQNGDSLIIKFERDARAAKRMSQDPGNFSYVKFETGDSSNPDIKWECGSADTGIKREDEPLINNASSSTVDCMFFITPSSLGAPQIVTWKFTLKSNRSDLDVEVPFRTSIQSRVQ